MKTCVGALRANITHYGVAQGCIGTFANASMCAEGIAELKSLNANELIMEALEGHPYRKDVMKFGAVCVQNLTDINDIAKVLTITPGVSEVSAPSFARHVSSVLSTGVRPRQQPVRLLCPRT